MDQKIIEMQIAKTSVIKRLDKLSLKGKDLLTQIKKWDCLIAGSFPLQCLLNEYYKNSDVDIYIKYKKENFTDFLHPLEKWIRANYKGYTVGHHYMIDGVFKSNKYILNEKTIINTVIVKTEESLQQYIYNNFDISFCMTMIDGDRLLYNELSKQKKGRVVNIKKNTVSKMTIIKKIGTNPNTRNHLRKMLFEKSKDPICSDNIIIFDGFCNKDILSKRITKYIDRGFEIDI